MTLGIGAASAATGSLSCLCLLYILPVAGGPRSRTPETAAAFQWRGLALNRACREEGEDVHPFFRPTWWMKRGGGMCVREQESALVESVYIRECESWKEREKPESDNCALNA